MGSAIGEFVVVGVPAHDTHSLPSDPKVTISFSVQSSKSSQLSTVTQLASHADRTITVISTSSLSQPLSSHAAQ